jgi:hypothetical protein
VEKEVTVRAFVGRTAYRFIAPKANNFNLAIILKVFHKDQGMLLVAKMLDLLHLSQDFSRFSASLSVSLSYTLWHTRER